ncbi:MAG: transcriptional regulator [Candidatus Nitrosotenuis sp.]|nr:MAG: transcriptional regulator [Candidatus Nitrosotenuis sp.]
MVGIDRLLSKSLDTVIRENLGARTVQKIENRLVEKYGITLTESIEQFQKLDSVLREFFGSSADGLENKFLKNVCEIKLVNGEKQIYIENSSLTKIILESFGDDDKKKILGVINGDALIISEIIERCDIAQTSGYRKINSLIDDGLLVPSGYISTTDGKKVTKYRSIFNNINIEIIKNKINVSLYLPESDFATSSILTVCSQ